MGDQTHRAETRLEKGDTAMEQQTTTQPSSSSQMWEQWEAFVSRSSGSFKRA
jgi:hypothetical protein